MQAIKTVIGLFTENENVEGAINELKERGYNPKDISLIMKDTREAQQIQENTGATIGEGAVNGATTGAIVGGVTGLLVGIGALALPGIGAFLIGGPLAASLGLTGAAASTATGAMTGAIAGGLIGALMSLGLPRDEAEHYESRIREGAILLAVPAYEGQENEISDAMRKFQASDIKSLSITTRTTIGTDTGALDNRTDANTFGQNPSSAFGAHNDAHHHGTGELANPLEVQQYLKHVDYPATKDDLVHEAEEEGADRNIIHTLKDLPKEQFNDPTDVNQAIGDMR